MKSTFVSAMTVLALLSGCSNDKVSVAEAHHRKHFSPPAVAAPSWPADSFDEARAKPHFEAAQAAGDKQNWSVARGEAEAGLALWPIKLEAWETLIAACDAQNDEQCGHYATFFHAKLLTLNGLPLRAATMGFETVADNQVGQKVDNFVYDQKTLDMATRLWVFCSQRDSMRPVSEEPTQEAFDDRYPYVPMLIVIGVGAGILSGIKSVAK